MCEMDYSVACSYHLATLSARSDAGGNAGPAPETLALATTHPTRVGKVANRVAATAPDGRLYWQRYKRMGGVRGAG